MSDNKGVQVIDLNKLGLEQLTALKNQLDQVGSLYVFWHNRTLFHKYKLKHVSTMHYLFQDLQYFTDSLQQLKIAQVKFSESGECVEKVSDSVHSVLVVLSLLV